MINQELLNYIQHQLDQGVTREEIKNTLVAHDWQPQDVDAALAQAGNAHPAQDPTDQEKLSVTRPESEVKSESFATQTASQAQQATKAASSTSDSQGAAWKIVLYILGGIAIFATGVLVGAYASSKFADTDTSAPITEQATTTQDEMKQKDSKTQETQAVTAEGSPQIPDHPYAQEVHALIQSIQENEGPSDAITFSEHMLTCSPINIAFDSGTLEREIVGISNGKCHYVEELINDEIMECYFSELQRAEVAGVYTALYLLSTTGGGTFTIMEDKCDPSCEAELISTDTQEPPRDDTDDFEPDSTPFQTALENGSCTITSN